ncbi:siderophore-interacting protein [Flexivirga oryzae]|uniref:NADPH-dependent ferric siderophore reductase n=1 Tax=Flexivirga oryzae TaxID=1794944 RepID=A0A839N628_9MICO|nr:siderophore-interacting protein [Flexivirga oryzae]MBB2891513.1 NADPH-dependent ferric siderophore reductase [Flexivirga oryzae]
MGFNDGRKISGLYRVEVDQSERVSPNVQRLTFAGDDLRTIPQHGYDQWFRLFLPHPDGTTDFDAVPEKFGIGGYLRYLTKKSGTRPPFRSYTVRTLRRERGELDVDFVIHGDTGIAGPWAQQAERGERAVILDQGRGFDPLDDANFVLLVGDDSALPAVAGILRDLPRDAQGLAIIELGDDDDRQSLDAPEHFEVRWLSRPDSHATPGLAALAEVQAFTPSDPATLQVYVGGEQAMVAGCRRHLVGAGVPKTRIQFTGYWKVGRAG